MAAKIQATSGDGQRFSTLLNQGCQRDGTEALGIAVAYVSIYGFNYINRIISQRRISKVNMVTDISDCVTHPNAIESAIDSGWKVRLVDNTSTFHPKFYVGCRKFDGSDAVVDPSFVITGSANLSYGGIFKNAECTFIQTGNILQSCSPTWTTLWSMGEAATKKSVTDYQKRFSERNRRRRSEDLVALGVADKIPEKIGGVPTKKSTPPTNSLRAIEKNGASTAWSELKTFTGEHTFQLEMPKNLAGVIGNILSKTDPDGTINIMCSDGGIRKFKFGYYGNNGMFRLNIPNDVPNARWARAEKQGIAVVELQDGGGIYFEIIRPSSRLHDVVDHSLALGTWGRTSTRLYGWY